MITEAHKKQLLIEALSQLDAPYIDGPHSIEELQDQVRDVQENSEGLSVDDTIDIQLSGTFETEMSLEELQNGLFTVMGENLTLQISNETLSEEFGLESVSVDFER